MADIDMNEVYIPKEQEDEFREAFTMFDANGDGTIDIPEFINTLKSMGQNPTKMEIDEMMKTIDANGDGLIDFEEFKHLMYTRMRTPDGPDDIKELFMVLDIDENGYFTAMELHQVIISLGENVTLEEARELISSTKTKERGKVNYEEFCNLISTLLTTPQLS